MMDTPFDNIDSKEICDLISPFVINDTKCFYDVSKLLDNIYYQKTDIFKESIIIQHIKNNLSYIDQHMSSSYNDEYHYFYMVCILEYLGIDSGEHFKCITSKEYVYDFLYDQAKYYKDVEKKRMWLRYLKPYFFKN